MEFIIHTTQSTLIAEVISDEVIVSSVDDCLDILGNTYYQNFEKLILHKANLAEEFFDLKTGLAGEILQKFSNYRMQLAIIGDFSAYTGQSIRSFIYESNHTGRIFFVSTVEEALEKLSN
jgi:hypothetical protein